MISTFLAPPSTFQAASKIYYLALYSKKENFGILDQPNLNNDDRNIVMAFLDEFTARWAASLERSTLNEAPLHIGCRNSGGESSSREEEEDGSE